MNRSRTMRIALLATTALVAAVGIPVVWREGDDQAGRGSRQH
jgi:hypothetical protein